MLDENSSQSLYIQLYKIISDKIKNRTYKAGDKIPSENDLSKRYGVNRHTARMALQKLKTNGLIFSEKGKGYFVAHIKVPYSITDKSNYSAQILEIGFEPSSKLIEATTQKADADTASFLNISENDEVVVIKLLRYVDSIPFAIYISYFDATRFKDLHRFIHDNESLTQTLIEKYKVEPIKDSSTFEAMMPSEDDAKLLMIPKTYPLLSSTVISHYKNNNIVEYGIAKFRSDLAKIKIKL